MIKSLIRPVLVTLCLTLLISWLFIKSRQTSHARYDEFSQLLTMVSRLDAEINAEVLKLEFQIHKSYDQLTQLEQSFTECSQEIRKYPEFAYDDQPESAEMLMSPMARKLELIADFKALHAVLENSVAIFYRSSEQLGECLAASPEFAQMRSELLLLQKAGMDFVLHSSQRGREAILARLEKFRDWNVDANCDAERFCQTMLAHSQNLLKAKPQMEALLMELNKILVPESLQAMHENAFRVFQIKSRRAAAYQVELLGATLLLIGYCGYSIYSIGRYVNTIRLTNEKLEERVRARTKDLERKSEVLRSNGRFLSSVLDAMDAKICILDGEGIINATNAGWDASSKDPYWLKSGMSYVQAFSENTKTIFGAPEVVEAIEKMKTTKDTSIVVEYDTNTSSEQQWIQARVNKMPSGPDRYMGFVVALIDITQRVKAEADKDKLNRELQSLSRQAGMAEVATGVLHNVGNVLNSINTASSQAARLVRTSRLSSLQKAEQLIREHEDDFATFVADDPRGRQLPKYISQIAKTWEEEQTQVLSELEELTKHIDHVKHVINVQQEHAKSSTVTQEVQMLLLIEDGIATIAPALRNAKIELVRELETVPIIHSDPHKIMQILINLLSNAKHAVLDSKALHPKIVTRCIATDSHLEVSVTDNGVGISPENLARICQHGFTTKKNGHGFGLHSCALLAKELGGELKFTSPGVNQGATFTLVLPKVNLSSVSERGLNYVNS